jgi:membrane fusion protein, multidrug efflux system
MRRTRKAGNFGLLLGALATCVAAAACTTRTAQTAPNLAVPVTVTKAVQKTIPIELTSIGAGEAYSTVSVESQVNAKLEAVHFQAGQFVKKGDLLFTLDARPFAAALAQAEATLARDKAQANLNEVQATRYRKLYEAGVTPKEQYDQTQASADAQQAAVRADEAAADASKLQLQYCAIYSPLDGVTGAIQVYPGNLVKQNDVPVMVVINQITPIFVNFAIPEQYLGLVKKYMAQGKLRVDAVPYGDTAAEIGYLTFVNNAVDNTTGTIKLKATFANADHRLWPGQFSTVVLRLAEQENATVVPTQAVQTGQNGDFVFVVKADMTAESRPVQVARNVGTESVIAKGLAPGETVVMDGQLRLIPGVKVQVKNGAAGAEGN